MRTTYLLVHLSSLDAVAGECLQSEWRALRDDLVALIHTDARFVVTDQTWLPPASSAHANVRAALEARSDTIWFPHDESVDDWDEAMDRLAALLTARGITNVTVIGSWLGDTSDLDLEGCVGATARHLTARGIGAVIDPDYCAHMEL